MALSNTFRLGQPTTPRLFRSVKNAMRSMQVNREGPLLALGNVPEQERKLHTQYEEDQPWNMSVEQMIRDRIAAGETQPFYVVDLLAAQKRVELWRSHLPTVTPFYAVKCNPDPGLIALFAQMQIGFDCASPEEICSVADAGVAPSRIVYANPCKQPNHLQIAKEHGVKLSTFDSVEELHKTARIQKDADLLLRIAVDDKDSRLPMSAKYGAKIEETEALLCAAYKLGLNVRGVSFHAGSGCDSPHQFAAAIGAAAHVHEVAARLGSPMDILDIGGGFPGDRDEHFVAIASAIRGALHEHFPSSRGVDLIAEPGRFLAHETHTLMVNVIGKKEVRSESDEVNSMYYVNDGIYASFNCIMYDHYHPTPTEALDSEGKRMHSEATTASVWGNTCDALDCIVRDTQLPELSVGDWLRFDGMGAYTVAAGSNFNGMPLAKKHYVYNTDS